VNFDAYDDIQAERKEPSTLTMESLKEAVDKLRSFGCIPPGSMATTWSSPWHPIGFAPRFFVSDYLPAATPRKLTRWERFRVWVEDLADRADVYYYYPRVKRVEPARAYVFGRDVYIPRAALKVLS